MTATLDLNTLSEPLRAVFQSVLGQLDEAENLRQTAEAEQRRLTIEVKLLKEAIRLLRLDKYGAKSEQLSDHQLALLELEPGVTREEVAAEIALPAREKKLTRVCRPAWPVTAARASAASRRDHSCAR